MINAPVDVSITVLGGIGQSNFSKNINIKIVAVKCPTGTTPTFDFAMQDPDGFGVGGFNKASGDTTFEVEILCCIGGTVQILNAGVDGIYKVRLYGFYI